MAQQMHQRLEEPDRVPLMLSPAELNRIIDFVILKSDDRCRHGQDGERGVCVCRHRSDDASTNGEAQMLKHKGERGGRRFTQVRLCMGDAGFRAIGVAQWQPQTRRDKTQRERENPNRGEQLRRK